MQQCTAVAATLNVTMYSVCSHFECIFRVRWVMKKSEEDLAIAKTLWDVMWTLPLRFIILDLRHRYLHVYHGSIQQYHKARAQIEEYQVKDRLSPFNRQQFNLLY